VMKSLAGGVRFSRPALSPGIGLRQRWIGSQDEQITVKRR